MSKKILVISPVPSHPQNAGNRVRINNLLANLQKLGHDLHFLHIEQETTDVSLMREAWGDKFYSLPYTQLGDRKRSILEKIVRRLRNLLSDYPRYPYALDDWYESSINKFIIELHKQVKFEIVIVEYVFFSRALENFGRDVFKIIDTHDIFNNRTEMYQRNGQEYHWYSTTLKEETKGLRRADCIIAIQKEEEKYFQKLVENQVITVGHTVTLRQPKELLLSNQKILYIASFNDTNVHGITYFIREVLPKVRMKLPDVQLLIAGKICQAVDEADGCIKLGYVNNVNDVYDTADLVINPILFGTGLKIKSIEALGQSKVLITTPEGAKGIEEGANKAFLVANNADEFAQYIVEILTNLTLSRQLSENAYIFAKKYNKEVGKPLEEILGNVPITTGK